MKNVNVATKMVIVGEDMIPFLLCDEHATAMTEMLADGVSATIYGLEADTEPRLCQACHLKDATKPGILLPGEDF